MNKLNIITTLAVLINLFACRNDKECHQDLVIINNSNAEIVFALKFYDGNQCSMDGRTIAFGSSFELAAPDECWENSGIDCYILNGSSSVTSEFFPCDSLDSFFDILAHYSYTNKELESRNFEISYP